jgi:hypothetical protein
MHGVVPAESFAHQPLERFPRRRRIAKSDLVLDDNVRHAVNSWIDGQIRVAKEEGAFDNLPGAGKPLPNLDQAYDPDWWVKQLVKREQISMVPPSLELLRKVEKELAAIEKLDDEATVRSRVAALNIEIAKANATVMEGPPTRLGRLDVDQVVARWRRARSAAV